MRSGEGEVTLFGRCYRLLIGAALKIEDKFFSELCVDQAEVLLAGLVSFLKAKSGSMGSASRVAQYQSRLVIEIKTTLFVLGIFRHLNLLGSTTSLLLEKNLLNFELAVLDLRQKPKVANGETRASAAKQAPRRPKPKFELKKVHQDIADFVRSRDQVRNLDVFANFHKISVRTLKRKLSELTRHGDIQRLTRGKDVFYKARTGHLTSDSQ